MPSNAIPQLNDPVQRLDQQKLPVAGALHLRDRHHTVLAFPVLVVGQRLETVARRGVEHPDQSIVRPRAHDRRVIRRDVDRHHRFRMSSDRSHHCPVQNVPDLDTLVHRRRKQQIPLLVEAQRHHRRSMAHQPVQRPVRQMRYLNSEVIGRRSDALPVRRPADIRDRPHMRRTHHQGLFQLFHLEHQHHCPLNHRQSPAMRRELRCRRQPPALPQRGHLSLDPEHPQRHTAPQDLPIAANRRLNLLLEPDGLIGISGHVTTLIRAIRWQMATWASDDHSCSEATTKIPLDRTATMNIAPSSNYKSSVSTADHQETSSNALSALPDTFRRQEGGAVPLSSQLSDRHPLETRVQNWEQTQRSRQLEQYRQIFGIAEPMKRVMQLEIVDRTDFNPLNQTALHRDILLNKEASVDWEDVYPGTGLRSGNVLGDDVHASIERSTGI
ncbi:hypothetical protein HG536_0A06850 [Torulaspora globosa]|uniref:Proteasome maturation factor UMP1 n=1 Tax=Torulaspora globosa TaxID=48254 RepID=A0A7G3ZBI4_9SACH|nr:uncharacterized protein HG536_0A06850 [Torulaspora globosa]QLL30870.1 hypothetical protein HG536_0A06850 [Torulaspora globosa]